MDHPARVPPTLDDLGQSLWIDNLSREMIGSGALVRRFREQGVRGATSNPVIFEKALRAGDAYRARIRELARAGSGAQATSSRDRT